MAKRTEKAQKPAKAEKAGRWTVRGVEPRLQKAAGSAARARGLTLGHWLNEVLSEATASDARPARLDQAIEGRLARLEDAVFGHGDPAVPHRPMGARAERPAAV